MGIVISASKSAKKDVTYKNPITGKASVAKVLPGVFETTIVEAEEVGGNKIKKRCLGASASYYGENFKGDGQISNISKILQGGESATPYVQNITGFIGIEHE